jgi:hypothetical protein
MAAPLRLRVLRICNFTENFTSYCNVYLLKYVTGNLRYVRRFSDSNDRIPEVEVSFSNG